LVCSSCGHNNPRENRYCGMCGTPFPHRFLPVPKEQSALTFPSAPIEIAPSRLPVDPVPPELSFVMATVEEAPPEIAQVEPQPSPMLSDPVVSMDEVPSVPAGQSAEAPPPETAPQIEPEPVGFEATVPAPSSETLVHEQPPVAEVAAPATAPEIIPVEISQPEPSPAREDFAPVADQPHPAVAASAEPRIEIPPTIQEPHKAPTPPDVVSEPTPPVSPEEPPPHTPQMPEIRRYATSHRDVPPDPVGTEPSTIHRPPAPQSLEPPPDSAGMPTFQAVAEAAGAPPITPFEPPVAKDDDEERELQEFIASFRYHPPEEAVDELTMRSEVPVLDAEAPLTPSHPSFDDDVPPPPEAGPHPTGEEYYPSAHASDDRSRYLEISDTHHTPAPHASTTSTTSFLGLDDAPVPPPDQLAPPARRHWLLWTSLGVLLAIFATLGFFEGRARRNPVYEGPIEIIQEQYAKLRQRVSEMTAPTPAADQHAAETPAATEPQPKPPAPDQPTTAGTTAQPDSSTTQTAPVSPAPQPAAKPDQQQAEAPAAEPPTTPAKDTAATPSASTAVVAPPKPSVETQSTPAPAATAAKRDTIDEPPPAVPKPKSKNDPGQQELANAMQASDPAAAAAWLWKATSRGNSVAPIRLADMYIKGRGVPHSCEQALVLLRSQADQGNAPARNRLAALYLSGTCVARDRVKAYQLMSSALASDPTSEWAQQNRKELWQQMTPAERAQAEKSR
jgi:hypothetical protein